MSKQTILLILPRRLYLGGNLCMCTIKHGPVSSFPMGEDAGDDATRNTRLYQTPLLTCLRISWARADVEALRGLWTAGDDPVE